ncbi:hypothetical protein MA16_Dca028552 [Dendrobium catenatum]|uniref:Uncharacterized protein n=1 Tax=Dendrobium catenatum TaxID=906689 RepID=A0A2I0VAJ9_9ASPA|nr:hypothetical protein MA16_Dca028552 [Dendrobium catenatum]
MRCRTHPSDSGIGVCPFCLRERLSSLAVADSSNGHVETSSPENHWDPDRSSAPRARLSSFGLCLSPMVRPIPANRRGHAPPETSFPSEKRGTFNRRCGSGGGAVVHELSPCLMANRSRKLVDFGRIVW